LVGILVIVWMSLSYLIPEQYAYLRNPLHVNMIIVVGTLSIFLVGTFLAQFNKRKPPSQQAKAINHARI
jgi:solute:Na+ symporter, SSS family